IDIVRKPFFSDCRKRIVLCYFRCSLLRLALSTRINLTIEQLPRLVAFFAGTLKRDLWISSEREQFLCTTVSVLQSPELRTIRLDEQKEPATVEQLVLLLFDLRGFNARIGE